MDLFLALTLLSSFSFQPQSSTAVRQDIPAPTRTTFVGRVLTPQGLPAARVGVGTSAGGTGFTSEDGDFELVVDVPREARYVEVTAAADEGGARDQRASARILPAVLAPTTSVGNLVLAPSRSAHARWLQEFDDTPGTNGIVYALASFDDGSGPALFAGGSFQFSPSGDSYVAKWGHTRKVPRAH